LTQDQLAESLEVTRQTISKWESDLAFPETAKISKLAEVLRKNLITSLMGMGLIGVDVSVERII